MPAWKPAWPGGLITTSSGSDVVVAAVVAFMTGRHSWQGTASELLAKLNGAVDSPESLGHWLRKVENLQQLKTVGFEITKAKDRTPNRTKLIRIERLGGGVK